MILAVIEHEKLLLNSLDEANQLLKILSTAKKVHRTYLPKKGEFITYETKCSPEISVQLVNDNELVTSEEALKMIKEDDKQRKQNVD